MDNSEISLAKHKALKAEEMYDRGRMAGLPDVSKRYFLESIAISLIVANNLAISKEERKLYEES